MTLTLHGIPNCDTVKKARGWLEGKGVAYAFRNYKKAPPSPEEVRGWADALGWEVLLNKAGTTFRKLPEADRADLDSEKAVALMAAHPSLIRRPLMTDGAPVLAGFKPEIWEARFG